MKKFCRYHLLQIFTLSDRTKAPIDVLACSYFRKNKAIGSKDRETICETLYGIILWKGLMDFLLEKPLSWEKRVDFYSTFSPSTYLSEENIPLPIRVSFPKWIFASLVQDYGIQNTIDFCLLSNQRAPTTIRINPLKTIRKELFMAWKGKYRTTSCLSSFLGIQFKEKINLFALPEFQKGLFELQDEGS